MSFYKTTIDPADKLFSTYIRTKAKWRCQLKLKCIGTIDFSTDKGALHCCHYHGRRKRSVRFDEKNCLAGCRSCHKYFDEVMPQKEKDEWMRRHLGDKEFEQLNMRANFSRVGQKPDKKMELLFVKEMVKQNEAKGNAESDTQS